MHGNVNAETDEEDPAGKENVFIPTDAARHRVPKVHSKKNPTQRKPKGRMYTNSQEDGNMTDASSFHSDEREDVPTFVDDDFVSSVCATKLVFIKNTIKRCYGCGQPFQHDKMVVPGSLVFLRKT